MSDLIANCYHLVGSELLKKNERDPSLIKASEFEGWLIPFGKEIVIDNYILE